MTLAHTTGWLLIACGISLTVTSGISGWQAYREHKKGDTAANEHTLFSLTTLMAALAIAASGYMIATA